MTTTRIFLACLFCLLCGARPLSAQAATISITPSYVQSFDAAQNPLGKLADNGATTPLDGYLQYEFRLSLDNLAADEDFWIAVFDIRLAPGLENASGWLDPGVAQANGYYSDTPSLAMYDSNGPSLGGIQAHWQFGNADFGLDSNDLKSIIVEASPQEAANRQYGEAVRPGQGAADGLDLPTLLGTILVRRTEVNSSSVAVVPIDGSAWGTYVNNRLGAGVFTSQEASSFTTSSLQLVVPEPASFSLLFGALLSTLLFSWRRKAGFAAAPQGNR